MITFSKDSWRVFIRNVENGILLSVIVRNGTRRKGRGKKKERWEGIRRVVADVDTAEIVQNIEITRVVHARLGENRDNLVLGAANETGFLQPPFVVGRFFFCEHDRILLLCKLLRKFSCKITLIFSIFFLRENERRREIENKKYLIRITKLYIWMERER